MRDINAGRDINVDGPVIITDNSQQQYKLLIHCTNEELLEEEPLRKQNLALERKGKLNRFLVFIAFAALLAFAAATWYWFKGEMDAFSLVSGATGLMLGIASLKIWEHPTEFEQRQIDALNEIHMILKERGVRR